MLNTKQKAFLKGLAHPLEPVLRVGKGRLTPKVLEEARRTMDAHELIKVRIDLEDGAERRQAATDLAAQLGADLVGTIGKVAMIYRRFEEKPKIKLP